MDVTLAINHLLLFVSPGNKTIYPAMTFLAILLHLWRTCKVASTFFIQEVQNSFLLYYTCLFCMTCLDCMTLSTTTSTLDVIELDHDNLIFAGHVSICVPNIIDAFGPATTLALQTKPSPSFLIYVTITTECLFLSASSSNKTIYPVIVSSIIFCIYE